MPALTRREYTEAERVARNLNEWRDDPEMHVANLNVRIRELERGMSALELQVMKLERS
jgi:hypothetical protein